MNSETLAVEGDQRQPIKAYAHRTPEDYLAMLSPDMRESLRADQQQAVLDLLHQAIPRPAPKIVDLRFAVDLIIQRFHVVVVVGKDRRDQPRPHRVGRATRVWNWIIGTSLLLGLNLLLSAGLFLLAYLLKSALGIDLLPGHFGSR